MVAATVDGEFCTNCAASRVVMCSMTTFNFGKSQGQRQQHGVDEHLLAVEEVDRRIGHFAMHQQRQADALHASASVS